MMRRKSEFLGLFSLKVVIWIGCGIGVSWGDSWTATAADWSWQDWSRESQDWWENSAQSTGTATRRSAIFTVLSSSTTTAATATARSRWTAQHAAAQTGKLLRDCRDFRRNNAGNESLEARNGLWWLNSQRLVLLNVRLVQLINEASLGVDKLVDFLREIWFSVISMLCTGVCVCALLRTTCN